MVEFSVIKRCRLFYGVPESRLREMLGGLKQMDTINYAKNDFIALEGDTVRNLKIILRGTVDARMLDASGKMIGIEELGAARMLAPAFLFSSEAKFPVELVAKTGVELLAIPKAEFLQLMQEEGIILQNYLQMISDRAAFLSRKIRFITFSTIRGKLASYLLRLSQELGRTNFEMPVSQVALAKAFGVSRPALSRALREMHKEGLVLIRGRKVNIPDVARLKILVKP